MHLRGGGSVTAIDLTRDQCAALADYLKERVELCHQGYDLIELLVLAQRALRNAAKAPEGSRKEFSQTTYARLTAYASRYGKDRVLARCRISEAAARQMLEGPPLHVELLKKVNAALDELDAVDPGPEAAVPKSGTPEGGGTVSAAREAAPARPSGASEAARFKRDTADRLVAYRSKWGPGCMGRLAALCGGDVNADKLTRMCDRERFPIETWRQVAAALDKLEGVCEDGRQSE